MSRSPVRLDSAAYRRLCKRRPGYGADDVLEYIRGERAFDEPEVRVIMGESKKYHLRGRLDRKRKVPWLNRYKDFDKLRIELHREHNMLEEAVPIDWQNLPFPNA